VAGKRNGIERKGKTAKRVVGPGEPEVDEGKRIESKGEREAGNGD